MKLSLKQAAALSNLRGNTDFDEFIQLLKEYEAEMTDRVIMCNDHATIARAQGSVAILRDLKHLITSAPEVLSKSSK